MDKATMMTPQNNQPVIADRSARFLLVSSFHIIRDCFARNDCILQWPDMNKGSFMDNSRHSPAKNQRDLRPAVGCS